MIGKCFFVLCALSLVFGAACGNITEVSNAALDGAAASVELTLTLVGNMCLWCGIMEVLRRPARQIADRVLDVLEQTTPELVADISKNGILLTGGGSQLWGMDQVLRDRTEMNCVVADDADSCVAYGCGKSLGWMNHMQEGTINISRRRLLKE